MPPRLRVNDTRPKYAGGRHDLVAAGPVEHHLVEAAPALDDVRAVARIPDEGVVSPAEEGRVSAAVAVDEVVAATTDEDLVATPADERVIAVLAVDPRCLGRRERAIDLVDPDGVVAVAGLDIDGAECAGGRTCGRLSRCLRGRPRAGSDRGLRRRAICSEDGPPTMRRVPSVTAALRPGSAAATGAAAIEAAMAANATPPSNVFLVISISCLCFRFESAAANDRIGEDRAKAIRRYGRDRFHPFVGGIPADLLG